MNAGKPSTRPILRLGKPAPPKVAAMVKAVRVKVPPPTREQARPQRIAWRVEDLAKCREQFPALFDAERPLPLAIGIHKQLAKVIGLKRAKRLMVWWTDWGPYVAAIAAGGVRYNLDGSVAGPVTEAQREIARSTLKISEPPREEAA